MRLLFISSGGAYRNADGFTRLVKYKPRTIFSLGIDETLKYCL